MIEAKKNAAYYLSLPAIDSASPASYKSGVSPVDTGYYKDGTGAWTALAIADTATEIGSTGVYEIDLTAAEMNHDKVMIKFAVSGMADDAFQFDLRVKLTDDLQDLTAAQVNVEVDTGISDAALSTASALATAQSDLDTITGSDGVTLATAQANYAPNKVIPDAAGVAPTAAEIRTEIDSNSTKLDAAVSTRNSVAPLTAQQARDAMKLAPSAGTPAAGSVDTHLDDIDGKTTNLPTDPATETNVNANETKIDTLTTNLSTTDGKVDNIVAATITNAAGTDIAADIVAMKADTAAILVDTNELQADWTNGGRLDVIMDAILADTGELQIDWENGGRLDLILDSINANVTILADGVIKANTAGAFHIQMIDTSKNPVASQAVTVTRRLDNGSFASSTGAATTTDSNGVSYYTYVAADVNGTDAVAFKFSATGADDTYVFAKLSV